MPTYATLIKMTTEGAKKLKDVNQRYAAFVRNVKAQKGKVVGAYALMGRYDYLIVTEMPDDLAHMRVVLTAVQRGTAATETMVAIPMDDYLKIVAET